MFSNARVSGNHFWISGMHAGTPQGAVGGADAYVQTREALRRVRALVEACGATLADVTMLRVYLTDIRLRAEVGRARSELFTGEPPCSTLVEVSRLVADDLLVEIEAEGILPS
ncbi:hypothetical protein CGZ93_15225 [Enemella dayhoffiae]|uniref:RidA family protein n=2 Tax=Enemella dayhoffiae TaxID=2016507 RepID=A0A255GRJ7_9ACTN|nr:hypothetical protein CGZ93_15225 [Enemella dayhoffiae]